MEMRYHRTIHPPAGRVVRGGAVIRFSCQHCGRDYLLADAMAHLPLLCKGCGQRLNVPDPQPEQATMPEPPAEPAVVPPPPPAAVADAKPAVVDQVPAKANGDAEPFLSSDTRAKLELPVSAAGRPKVEGTVPRGRLAWLVDALVFVLLLAAGMLVGEMVVKKPTGEILSNAGSAPRFPP